ncbi:aminotransferase class I/II-fold pyridoxal phosphate-dependent enzyme [Catenuloplanes atrovinosus]|uniref:8-amino-7-oxononanoate synthase n=1 Tax=Catenuloplanes atrovinosus TaxID=137266 RepID=A0AAE3YJ61_9ACTN|nr:aminotransferase class I/II-fold pyridoxal phosphate-dependent enzyme [Catenuloplanes atrovinosus]MDR7274460.1 7-keto-8-aminopelargonate synthetase-like enzyme [Catenuloplanes atrovinosus]
MGVDLFARCRDYEVARAARAAGVYPYYQAFSGPCGATAVLDGRTVIMCGSSDYLGLAADPRVIRAAQDAAAAYGTSRAGSRMLNGGTPLHAELERELAAYAGMPDALLFPTGYQANVGTIAGLTGRRDAVLVDAEAHASAYDGAALGPGRAARFRHNSPAALDRLLAAQSGDAARLVVVDGLYSMSGESCPLPSMITTCRRYGARLLVDDAHGFGVRALDVDGVDLLTVTFSKALASVGGAVLGPPEVIDYLRHHARAEIYSAVAPPSSVAAALAALRIAAAEPWRGARAVAAAAALRAALISMGHAVPPGTGPIVSLPMPDLPATLAAWHGLLAAGVYVNPVVPPAARCSLRITTTAAHTDAHLATVVAALAALS